MRPTAPSQNHRLTHAGADNSNGRLSASETACSQIAGMRQRRRPKPGLSLTRFASVALPVFALFGYAVFAKPTGAVGERTAASPAFFANCSQAHAAGRYDIPRSDPAYRAALDADRDGLACEPYPR